MEIEYLVPADTKEAEKHFDYWKQESMKYRKETLKISEKNLQFKKHDKLAHYAADAYDIEYQFPRGW
jgi:glycyl-tRNA synthetase